MSHRAAALTATVVSAVLLVAALPSAAEASTATEPEVVQRGSTVEADVPVEVFDRVAAADEPGADLLLAGEELWPGEGLVSPSGRYALVVTEDGLVALVEAPNTYNPDPLVLAVIAEGQPGSFLAMQTDGNLVLYTPSGGVAANFATSGTGADRLAMQDDRNIVLYAPGSVVIDFDTDSFSTLLSGEVLLSGDRLVSENGRTVLAMQTDGNLVVYQDGVVRYASRTVGRSTAGADAVMQTDGNLVIYRRSTALWWTGTSNPSGLSGEEANVLALDVGEFSILSGGEQPLSLFGSAWQSNIVSPGQVLVPGDRRTFDFDGRSRLVFQTDGNLVQYQDNRPVFQTRTAGTAANVAIMQTDGNFVVYAVSRTGAVRVLFQTGTGGRPGAYLRIPPRGGPVQVLSVGGAVLYPR